MGGQKIPKAIAKTTNPSIAVDSSSTSDLALLIQRTSLAGEMGSEASMLRRSSPTLTSLRTLHPSESLVLFTPVVPPPLDDDTSANTDPFEPLGRALGLFHKRIRHVPYVPNAGMTDTHLAFLRHAGAVVIVVCDMPNATSIKGSEYDFQRGFASSVVRNALDNEDLRDVPIVLLIISGDAAQRSTDFEEFKAVFRARSYSAEGLRHVASVMVG